MTSIAVDLDGVLFDFNGAFHKALKEISGRDLTPTFTSWNWDQDAGYTAEEINKAWTEKVQKSPTFWRKLDPLPGAKEMVRQLNRLEREDNGVYFITARSLGVKPRVQTEEALYDLGMNYPAVIISASKTPILRSLGVEFFIDDKLENMLEFAPLGEYRQHFYLLDAPYNRVGRQNLKVVGTVEQALRMANLWKDTPTK